MPINTHCLYCSGAPSLSACTLTSTMQMCHLHTQHSTLPVNSDSLSISIPGPTFLIGNKTVSIRWLNQEWAEETGLKQQYLLHCHLLQEQGWCIWAVVWASGSRRRETAPQGSPRPPHGDAASQRRCSCTHRQVRCRDRHTQLRSSGMPVKAWLSEVPAPTNTNGVVSLQCCFYFSLLSITIYLVTHCRCNFEEKKRITNYM